MAPWLSGFAPGRSARSVPTILALHELVHPASRRAAAVRVVLAASLPSTGGQAQPQARPCPDSGCAGALRGATAGRPRLRSCENKLTTLPVGQSSKSNAGLLVTPALSRSAAGRPNDEPCRKAGAREPADSRDAGVWRRGRGGGSPVLSRARRGPGQQEAHQAQEALGSDGCTRSAFNDACIALLGRELGRSRRWRAGNF